MEIERGREEKREDSLVSKFPSPGFRFMRILADWMSFYSKVSAM